MIKISMQVAAITSCMVDEHEVFKKYLTLEKIK